MNNNKLSKKNWFIIIMFLWAGIVCIFALPPLYFLIKKGFDIEEKKNVEVAQYE